ncbi:hypothetical protein ACN47E_005855 [Coniothyrium glycines]
MHATTLYITFALLPIVFAAPSNSLYSSSHSLLRARQSDTTNTTIPESSDSPSCNLNNVAQPSNTLQPPSADLQLILIALGQGTQNYTCSSPTATPFAIGAVAQLFNASCEVSANPSAATTALGSITESPAIGAHFFVDNTTPDFDIFGLGNTQAKKVEDTNAPQPAKDIKWLRLQAQTQGTTSSVKEIYRLNTVGGLAPGSCEGKAAGEVVTVEYQAQYWVYA